MSTPAATKRDPAAPAAPRLWSPDPLPAPAAEPAVPAPEPLAPAVTTTRRKRTPRQVPPEAAVPAAAPEPAASRVRYSPTIKELPADERPRERLIKYGAQVLSTAELIAILIRVGTAERSAVSLGEHLLAHFGNIKGVAGASVEELSRIKGIGGAKAAEIKAAIEFGNRLTLFTDDVRPAIGSPRDVFNLLSPELRYLKKEVLKSLLLDSKNRVLSIKMVCTVSKGNCVWTVE